MEKLILTDVDGVLLNWEDHFHAFMSSQGHQRAYDAGPNYWQEMNYPSLSKVEARKAVYHFNTSSWLLNMPAYKDAISGVARLREAGYRFHAITAMGGDEPSRMVREICLERLFGYDTFVEVTSTPMYGDDSKTAALTEYKDSGLPWLEDKTTNANLGDELGLTSFLFDHPHNEHNPVNEYVQRVNSWQDLIDNYLLKLN